MQIFGKFEDVLNFAIGQEQAAQQFYTELAGKVTSPEVQDLYRSLAKEENKHEQNLKAIKKLNLSVDQSDLEAVKKSGYLNAENVPTGITLKEAIGFALEKEKSAHMLYAMLADLIEDKEIVRVLAQLADEESRHVAYFKAEYAKYGGQ